jgi:hypothetical protein
MFLLNSYRQIRKPKPESLELIAMNITAEHINIHCELQLFRDILDTSPEVSY